MIKQTAEVGRYAKLKGGGGDRERDMQTEKKIEKETAAETETESETVRGWLCRDVLVNLRLEGPGAAEG